MRSSVCVCERERERGRDRESEEREIFQCEYACLSIYLVLRDNYRDWKKTVAIAI